MQWSGWPKLGNGPMYALSWGVERGVAAAKVVVPLQSTETVVAVVEAVATRGQYSPVAAKEGAAAAV